MPKIAIYDDEIRVKVTKEFKQKLEMVSKRRGGTSEYVRQVLELAMSEDSAKDGMDTVTAAVRKAVKDQTKGFENRVAAMVYKDTVASQTAVNLLLLFFEQQGHDAVGFFEEAQKQAIAYANSRSNYSSNPKGEEDE